MDIRGFGMDFPQGTDLDVTIEIPLPDGKIRDVRLGDCELSDLEARQEWLKSGEGTPTAFDWEFLEVQLLPGLELG